jgi:hypothetical protein
MSLVFAEVISVRVEPFTQMQTAHRTRFDTQAAAFAFFAMHFDPTAIFFFFAVIWHMNTPPPSVYGDRTLDFGKLCACLSECVCNSRRRFLGITGAA